MSRIERMVPWLVVIFACMPAPAARAGESLIDTRTFRGPAADTGARHVGDILTIQVLEATRARSTAATDAGSGVDLQLTATSSHTHTRSAASLSGASRGRAQTSRTGEFQTQLAVRVVAVEGDLLSIEGRQTLTINGELQQIHLRGVVRAEDVGSDNTLWSNRIADAEVELTGNGVVSESQRQGIIYRVLKWLRLL